MNPTAAPGLHKARGDEPVFGFAVASGALWGALVLHKVGVLAFSFRLGHLADAAGVGVMTSVLNIAWLVSALVACGLPDRSVFLAAEARGRDLRLGEWVRGLHLLFTLLVSLGFIVLIGVGPLVGGDPSLGAFARCLLAGAAAQGLAAFSVGLRRGAGRPGVEAAGNLLSGFTLVIAGLVSRDMRVLSALWVVSGFAYLLPSVVAWFRDPELRPRAVSTRREGRGGEGTHLSELSLALRESLPYLGLGLGGWLVGNTDILLGRVFCTPEEMGFLQVATTIVRSVSLLPWILATLLLHRLERRWAQDRSGLVPQIAGANAVLGVLVGVGGWIVLPFLARGYHVDLEQVRTPAILSLCCAPATYAALSLMPVGGARSLKRTLTGIALGLGVSVLCGLALVPQLRVTGAVLSVVCGQLTWLVLARWAITKAPSPRESTS